MKRNNEILKPLLSGVLLLSAVFAVELDAEALVGTVAYIFVTLVILWFLRISRSVVFIGILASVFIITAYLIITPEAATNVAFGINRLLSLAIVWLAVYFALRYGKVYHLQQERTSQLNALFESAHEGVLFTDPNGNIILANPFLEKMFGYSPGELINRNINQLMPPKYNASHELYLKNYASRPEHRSKGRDLVAQHRSGMQFPVEISLSFFESNGEVVIIAFILDATEKKQHQQIVEANFSRIKNYNIELEEKVKQRTEELQSANEQLRKSQYLYKAMARHFPDGVMGVLDRNMQYLLVSGDEVSYSRYRENPGYGEVLLNQIRNAISGPAGGSVAEIFGGKTLSFDIQVEEKIYNVTSVPMAVNGQEINEILIVARNITEKKRIEDDLIRTLQKEKELSILKSRFVTMASHEFRSPLTTVLSSVFLLEQYNGERLEQEKSKHLSRIKRSVQSLTELLNDFLSLGKLEEGKIAVNFEETDLDELIEELLSDAELLKKPGQQLALEYKASDILLMTDRKLLKHALINLISNAIKYSSPAGIIRISVSVSGSRVSVGVKDNGIGIPEAEQRHIFKRFFRARNAADIQGTGLGLNIAKKYIQLLNGDISFSSRMDEGTTFSVNLPLWTDIEMKKTLKPTEKT